MGARGVWHLSRSLSVALRDSAARLHGANDILQVADAPGEAINTARFEFRKMRCRCYSPGGLARVTRDQLGGSHEETDFGSVAHFHSRDGRRMGTALCSQRRGRDEWALASQF